MNDLTSPSVNFLEANTNAITLEELTEQCVVPTWANQELTISHQDFITTVHDAEFQTLTCYALMQTWDGEGKCQPLKELSFLGFKQLT